MPSPPRSVKIADDERGGWSSERPRRPGEPERPPRPVDVSVRGRALSPSDRVRYSPGSLLLLASTDPATREAFAARVLSEPNAFLSMAKVRGLLAGRVPDDEIDAKAGELLDAAATKRLASGQTVVVALETLEPAERERYVRMAAAYRRPRHLILVEAGKETVAEEDRAALSELRTAIDGGGGLGAEGFVTALRLGGRAVDELKRIVFQPPPADD
jgi:predicted kinase